MTSLRRLFHRARGRYHARLAAKLQRNLTEYVLAEESRIAILLHRAAWHHARGKRPEKIQQFDLTEPQQTAPANGHAFAPAHPRLAARSLDAEASP